MDINSLWDRVFQLEQQVSDLRSRQMNFAGRGVLESNTDDKKLQQQTIGGLYGERQENVERVETFGLTSMPPEGSDVFYLAMNGNRDSLLVLSAASPDHRPTNSAAGSTTLYDLDGTTIVLDGGGNIVVSCGGDITFQAGGKVSINSASLDHNGVNIGDDHKHVSAPSGPPGVPIGG